jgi:MFS family permease
VSTRVGLFAAIDASGRVVLAARAIRAFAQGILTVLLALFLTSRGVSLSGVGLFLSAGVVGGAVFALALQGMAARLGLRRSLIALTLLSAAASLGLLLSDDLAWLMGCAFAGSLAGIGGAGGAGPAQPLEQAILVDAVPADRRADVFALYRFGSSIAMALGGLAAGIPSGLEAVFRVPLRSGMAAMVVGFSLCLVAVAILYSALPAELAGRPRVRGWAFANPFTTPSRHLILRLNALFSVDQLGSSLTTASLMAYWFHTRIGLQLDELATLSFGAQLLSALSMWLSAQLARRIGYVRTMVYTHIPASLMLVGLAFAPNAQWAVALWLARGLLSQMDIPARDALTMSVVAPEERIAMGSLSLLGRNGMGTIGPTLSTTLWQVLSPTAPILLGGLLKVGYDLSLYAFYRDLEGPSPD